MKINKKISFLLTIAITFVISITGVNAAAIASTNEYFKTSRKGETVSKNTSIIKHNESIPSEYNFALGSKYESYEVTAPKNATLNETEINNWNYAENTANAGKTSDQYANLKAGLKHVKATIDKSSIVNGKFSITYKNVDNKNIDVRLSIVDFAISDAYKQYTSIPQYQARVPFIGLYDNEHNPNKTGTQNPGEEDVAMGVFVGAIDWIEVKYEFFKSGTTTPENVKGYTTYWDVDWYQGIHFLDGNPTLYSDAKNLNYVDLKGVPFIYENENKSYTGFDSNVAVTETFEGNSISRVYSFASPNTGATDREVIKSASGGIWNSAIVNGSLKRYASDTKAGKDGAAVKEGDSIKYEIQYTNGDSNNKADVTITDTLSKGLEYVQGSASLAPASVKQEKGLTVITWKTNLNAASTGSLTYEAKVVQGYENNKVNNNAKATIGKHTYNLSPLENPIGKIAKVITKYLEVGTNKVLAPESIENKNYGEQYQTTKLKIDGYKYVKSTNNTSGVVNQDEIVVIYYYDSNKVEKDVNAPNTASSIAFKVVAVGIILVIISAVFICKKYNINPIDTLKKPSKK